MFKKICDNPLNHPKLINYYPSNIFLFILALPSIPNVYVRFFRTKRVGEVLILLPIKFSLEYKMYSCILLDLPPFYS